MNKKFLMWIGIAILSGLTLGNIFYRQYEKEQNLDNDYNTYLLQLGIYHSSEELESKTKNIENYMVIERDNKFYVYLGISTKKDNAEKVQEAFSDNNINVTIKRSVINDIEFMSNLEQFDILLDSASTNEVILSSYEEMVLTD